MIELSKIEIEAPSSHHFYTWLWNKTPPLSPILGM